MSPAHEIARQWLGWAAAAMAVVCFGLGLASVHKGRAVRISTEAIAADIVSVDRLIAPLDLASVGRVGGQLDQLAGVLGRLRQATAGEVDVLLAAQAEVERLLAVAGDDLGIGNALAKTATALAARTVSLAQVAGAAEAGTGELGSLLKRIGDLVVAINAELAALERKLAILPTLGG